MLALVPVTELVSRTEIVSVVAVSRVTEKVATPFVMVTLAGKIAAPGAGGVNVVGNSW